MEHCSSCACRNANMGCGTGCFYVMMALKCAYARSMGKSAWTGAGGGTSSSSDASSIMRSSSLTLGELAGKPALIRLAWWLWRAVERVAIARFIPVESLSHRVSPPVVMEKCRTYKHKITQFYLLEL